MALRPTSVYRKRMGSSSCPFCRRTRAVRIEQTDLLNYYRCEYCFKQWGEARVTSRESMHNALDVFSRRPPPE
jgi:transposase-like protein